MCLSQTLLVAAAAVFSVFFAALYIRYRHVRAKLRKIEEENDNDSSGGAD